jgi:4-alpha-glucanotransferase
MNSSRPRLAGVLLPAFSARRDGDLGIGDTRALIEWMDWAAETGVGFLQLLPIHHNGSDESPYNAISSVALEPLYLTMEEIPGLEENEFSQARNLLGAEVMDAQMVNYTKVRACKNDLLQIGYARFLSGDFSQEKCDFQLFQKNEASWLGDFVLYRWLMDQAGGSEQWDQWPAAFCHAARAREYFDRQLIERGDVVQEELDFHAWVQWLCFRQWRQVRKHADQCGVKLMGDVPIGISYYSADVFFQPEIFDLSWFGGAPPETMFKHDRFIQRWGQNWGVPLYRWDFLEQSDSSWWKQRVQKLTEIFHIFRIDHILGFYRMYAFPWHPNRNAEFLDLTAEEASRLTGGHLPQWAWRDDESEENRAANRDDGDKRLRALIAAVGEAQIVGEDLGCVPEYVRPHLESLDIAGFRIPHWDSDQGQVVKGSRFPECSFATFATHDHDPMAALWESYRLDAVGARSVEPEEQQKARESIRLMAEFGGILIDPENPPAYDFPIRWQLLDALLASRSRYVALMITDVFGLTNRYNKPGTVNAENWSFRLPFTCSRMRNDPSFQADLAQLRLCLEKNRGLTPPP